MKKGTKKELIPLQRYDKSDALGQNDYDPDDPQYNGLLLEKLPIVVFYDLGLGELGAVFFRDQEKAHGWCQEKMLSQMRGEKI